MQKYIENYKTDIIFDKRKFLEYYLSLLKKNHLIILIFISNNDYNVFLFTDSTMKRMSKRILENKERT